MSTLSSYKDGSLGGPNMAAIHDGSLGNLNMASYRDGSLGCGCGVQGLGQEDSGSGIKFVGAGLGVLALLFFVMTDSVRKKA